MVDRVKPEGFEYFHLRTRSWDGAQGQLVNSDLTVFQYHSSGSGWRSPEGLQPVWGRPRESDKNTSKPSRLGFCIALGLRVWAVARSEPPSKLGEKEHSMKKLYCLTLARALSVSAFAQAPTVVRWHQIVGVITAPGVDNPVAGVTDSNNNTVNQIHSGTLPWTTRRGSARVNLASGEGSFEVEGLVLNGGSATGTPGPINSVVGTLVCNPGAPNQDIIDTTSVPLSPAGNAELSFRLNVPSACSTPLFLIRIPQAGLRWIATAAMPFTGYAATF